MTSHFYINDDFTEGLLSSNRTGGNGSDDIYRVFVYGSSYINKPHIAVAPDVENVSKAAEIDIEQKVVEQTNEVVTTTTTTKVKDNVETIETTWKSEKAEPQLSEKEFEHIEQQESKGIDVVMPIIEELKIKEEVTYVEEELKEEVIKEKAQQIISEVEEKVAQISKEQTKEVFVNPPEEKTKDFKISGEVIDSEGKKMAYATIEMNYGKRGDSVVVRTDANGKFSSDVECCTAVNVAAFKTNYYTDRITVDMRDTMPNYRILLTMKAFQVNKGVRLRNLYFDRDQYYLRDEARLELDRVARLLKDNGHIKVEIGAHTDSKGSEEKNLTLSDKRAKVVVEYLVKKGVPSYRLRAKGYGESALLNHCTDELYCTDDLHAENRRIEFKITDLGNYQEEALVVTEVVVVDVPRTNYEYQAPEQTVNTTTEVVTSSTSTSVGNDEVKYTEIITEEPIVFDEIVTASDVVPKPVVNETAVTSTTTTSVTANVQMYGGDVSYRIQLGAFSSPKLHLFTHLSDMGNLDQYGEAGLYKYLVGYYYSMASAESAVEEIRRRGIPDAFIVGFQNGKKITKEEAQQYLY